MAWTLLVAAGLLEIVWAIALKEAEGFTRLWPSVIGLVTAWVSFILLTLALKSLPAGTAYAVGVGIGAVGVAVVGMIWFRAPATPARLAFLALVVVGIMGLKFAEG